MVRISKEAEIIFESMEHRLNELWRKLISGRYNDATDMAYKIGFILDIDDALKALKLKRTFDKKVTKNRKANHHHR